MRFLLLGVSILFSFFFFFLYLSENSDTIIKDGNIHYQSLLNFSNETLFLSFVFFTLGIFFFFFFSSVARESIQKMKNSSHIGKIIFFSYLLFFYFFSPLLWGDHIFFLSSLLFFFSFFIFQFLLFIKKHNTTLQYIGLFSLYLSISLVIYYLYGSSFNIGAFSILLYGVIFNFLFHKKYSNYVCLCFSILSGVFFIYFLQTFFFEVYIEYIYIYFPYL